MSERGEQSPLVLYVDDDRPNLDLFRRCFEDELHLRLADSPAKALSLLEQERVGVLITDQRMPGMSGLELLVRAAERWPAVSRMLLTAYSDRELLLAAINQGHVQDYVLKPWEAKDLGLRLQRGLDAFIRNEERLRAERERDLLAERLVEWGVLSEMVGLEGGLAPLAQRIDKLARTDSTVLIRGESGTGKELVAREIHRRSGRAARAFVRINCAAFSESLLESELFGHEAGAFTGAVRRRAGRFEQADGGTLLLDEIGDVSPAIQVKLLRVLQEQEFERVGGNESVKVSIRLLAATHRDLEALVAAGRFREDLFHRLSVVPLWIPPLRERPVDLEPLARHFLAHFARQMGKRLRLAPDAQASLLRYDWPGNVRELRNVVERACALADDDAEIEAADLSFDFAHVARTPAPQGSVFEEIAQAEAERIKAALFQAGGSKARAARLLGLPRTTLNDRLKKLGIG